jgi:hypothetical protein
MDTRYWGPSGWRLLHLISFANTGTTRVCEFMNTLPYILPCKYCRMNLTKNFQKFPLNDIILFDCVSFETKKIVLNK